MGNGRKEKHHIVPTSRRKNGTQENGDNISWIGKKLHQKYHSLFANRVPEEIIDFLVNYFWKGKVGFVENYLKKYHGKEVISVPNLHTYTRCPHCHVWDFHRVVDLRGKQLQIKCKKCLRIFTY